MKLRNKKTGEIIETDFELSVSIPDDEKLYGNDTYTQIKGYSSIKELSEDWEDVEEEPVRHWFISGTRVYEENGYSDEGIASLESVGNHFKSKEEAELAVEKLKAFKRLKDKGFKFCKYTALAYGEINFRIPDFEGWNNSETEQVRKDLDLLFGGAEWIKYGGEE